MIGKTISQYKISKKLGEGGMGVVYRASDTKLDRQVAIKFLPHQVAVSEEERKRFKIEAKAAASLNHPNIATIYNIEEVSDEAFIVMEYIKGRELKEIIESGPLPIEDVLDFALQIAAGLQAAHEAGVVHRDIKSANIMLTEKNAIKIMDFGLAKRHGGSKLTKEGTTLGTAAYMSPEQARGDDVDGRSDIWSYAVLLYEMISGQLPFKGDYEQALIYSVMNEEPQPITGLRTGVPMQLEQIVHKAMAKERDERYQSIVEMSVDLKRVAQNRGAGGSRGGKIESKPPKRNRGVMIGATMLLSFALIASVFYFFLPSLFTGPQADFNSVAVLPFENLSREPDQDYFVDGMHEALILDLSKVTDLKVISRTSMMRYKATDKSIPEIARELDVDALIEGSVLRVGDQVRITAQLIHGETDEHLWAENYDRDLQDVLVMISQVARSIVGKVKLALPRQEENVVLSTRSIDPAAHDAYLKGRFSFNTITPAGILKSVEYYQEAITIDSSFALAWASLGASYMLQAYFGMASTIPEGKAAALKALEIDKDLALAHTTLGWILVSEWKWPEAEKAFRKALDINPNDPYAQHGYADYLTAMGLADEGLIHARRGRDIDPFAPVTNAPYVGHLFMARRYDEVIFSVKKLVEQDPAYGNMLDIYTGAALWQKGMHKEALAEFKKTQYLSNKESVAALDRSFDEDGPQAAMTAAARSLEAASASRPIDHATVAAFYARAGDLESTLHWLEKAMENPAPNVWLFSANPVFDFVRSEQRFQALLRRMGLPVEN